MGLIAVKVVSLVHTRLTQTPWGRRELAITRSDGEIVHIPVAAVASRRELLGIDDPAEVVEAILSIEAKGEPTPDPESGENAWTEAYELLSVREQAREDAAESAMDDGLTRAQVAERANQAAYDAVHIPDESGECVMDRCRRTARERLGLPEPARKPGADSRSRPMPLAVRRPAAMRAMRPAGGKAEIADALADQGEYLMICTRQFLHSLTDRQECFDAEEDQ